MPALFDEAALLDRVDSDWEFLGETVEMLASDGPALLTAIGEALQSRDAAAVGRAAHTLKGMVANFCADGPHARAFELERMGKAGDLSGAAPVLAALDADVQALIAELRTLVARAR